MTINFYQIFQIYRRKYRWRGPNSYCSTILGIQTLPLRYFSANYQYILTNRDRRFHWNAHNRNWCSFRHKGRQKHIFPEDSAADNLEYRELHSTLEWTSSKLEVLSLKYWRFIANTIPWKKITLNSKMKIPRIKKKWSQKWFQGNFPLWAYYPKVKKMLKNSIKYLIKMWKSFFLTTKYIFWPLFIKTDVSEFNRICLQILARSVHLKGRFEWVRGSMKSAFAKRAPTIHRKIENTYLRYHLKRSARNEAINVKVRTKPIHIPFSLAQVLLSIDSDINYKLDGFDLVG